ncbi:hypothetical protein [Streptomyces gilvus]|uniref:hypothetical protein n=1 Tax=Streptomyces gilvus TaxID=2920937 RepID=UPI001F1190B8|nr:hypothetical protein [Streptomyces sp. CME 23]MCH5677934.1 hypothetical protein [Streptomyces sp. CME 23]
MTTTPTRRDQLAGHLAQAENWVLGAEFDGREFEKQIAEAEQDLAQVARVFSMADANARTVTGDGPDAVSFRSDVDREVAAYHAVTQARAAKVNWLAAQQTLDTLKAKQANSKTALHQAKALRLRIELALQADELPSIVDELEALLED